MLLQKLIENLRVTSSYKLFHFILSEKGKFFVLFV